MAIVGKMSDEALARVLEKKRDEQARAERRRKAREQREAREQAARPLTHNAKGNEQLNLVATRMMEEQRAAEKQGLRRRDARGRYISREAQAEAIARADDLAKRGF